MSCGEFLQESPALVPVSLEASRAGIDAIAASQDISYVWKQHEHALPLGEENNLLDEIICYVSDFGSDSLESFLGLHDNAYPLATDGATAYLHALELTAEARGLSVPRLGGLVHTMYDRSLLEVDANMAEVAREEAETAKHAKEFTDEGGGSLIFGGRHILPSEEATAQRRQSLQQRLDALHELEPNFVAAYNQNPMYPDQQSTDYFLLGPTILHDMVTLAAEASNFEDMWNS